MRPPVNSLIKIKRFCEKNQCRQCDYGQVYDNGEHYVSCTLLDTAPCDWHIKGEELYENGTSKKERKKVKETN